MSECVLVQNPNSFSLRLSTHPLTNYTHWSLPESTHCYVSIKLMISVDPEELIMGKTFDLTASLERIVLFSFRTLR